MSDNEFIGSQLPVGHVNTQREEEEDGRQGASMVANEGGDSGSDGEDGRKRKRSRSPAVVLREVRSPGRGRSVSVEARQGRSLPRWLGVGGFGDDKESFESAKARCERVLRECERSTGYYIADVFEYATREIALEASRTFSRNSQSFTRGFVLVCHEDLTVHTVHDCSWSNQACRCAWIKKTEIEYGVGRRVRPRRTRRPINQLKLSDIAHIFIYYAKGKRVTKRVQIGGRVEGVQDATEFMEEFRSSEREASGLLEAQAQDDDPELQLQRHEDNESARRSRRCRDELSAAKRSKPSKSVSRMENIIVMCQKYPTCPIQAIVQCPMWLNDDDLKFMNQTHFDVKNALNTWTNKLVSWSLEDFNMLYQQDGCEPYFQSGFTDTNYYYNIKDSLDVLKKLLQFQFNDDEEEVNYFMLDLYNILERKLPKLNTIVIHSPPSAGKNFFMDCIVAFFLNVGHMCRANKTNNFAFADAANRRVIMWNEPNYSSDFVEILKELFGGDSTNVNVKHKDDVPIFRTPIIVLTNSVLSFMQDPVFKDRITTYNWRAAPFLQHHTKKPNPLAVYALFKEYNLVK